MIFDLNILKSKIVQPQHPHPIKSQSSDLQLTADYRMKRTQQCPLDISPFRSPVQDSAATLVDVILRSFPSMEMPHAATEPPQAILEYMAELGPKVR